MSQVQPRGLASRWRKKRSLEVGEGALAICFDADTSEFEVEILGANAGSATLRFSRADGSLIDTIVLTSPRRA
jgi:hypothetical protein